MRMNLSARLRLVFKSSLMKSRFAPDLVWVFDAGPNIDTPVLYLSAAGANMALLEFQKGPYVQSSIA